MEAARERDVLEMAMTAGHILLESGAELGRVEETMGRICRHYGVTSYSPFIFANGIFVTAGNRREAPFARVEHIPVGGGRLDRVEAVNQLSREIAEGRYTVEEAAERLEQIRVMPGKSRLQQILAAACGSAAFCVLVGGTVRDGACAFASGILLYLFVIFVSRPYLSKLVGNLLGSALVTVACSLFFSLGLGQHMNYMVIGSIMPLIPGVAFVNAIRDIAGGDYISGSVRMMDALLVFCCIATGVGVVFGLMGRMGGGVL